MIFLHSHGVSTSRAVRIFKTYGADAIQILSENPYRLARDVRGIGFKTADAIAARLGIEKTAMIRARAGIGFTLTEAMDDGHCGLPLDELVPMAEQLPGPASRSPRASGRHSGSLCSRKCWSSPVVQGGR
jgi:exodeoxyribonuclease V alpha subunit